MLINNKKLLHHILPILVLALLGMRTAQAVAPGIVIPPKALFTQQGGAYGRCPNGTRALTVAELRGNAELQTYLRQITPGWSIYGLYDGTYLGQAYGGIIKERRQARGSFIAKLSASRPYTRPGNRLRITTTARSRPRACSPAPTAGCARYSSGTAIGHRSLRQPV